MATEMYIDTTAGVLTEAYYDAMREQQLKHLEHCLEPLNDAFNPIQREQLREVFKRVLGIVDAG